MYRVMYYYHVHDFYPWMSINIYVYIYVYTNQLVSIVSLGMTWTPSLKPTTVFPGSSTWVPTPGELLVRGPVGLGF